jgi:hypothetical protein
MSLNLYNAFRTESPLPELHTALSSLSVKVRKEAGKMFTDYVTREIVYFYDLWSVGLGPSTIHPAGYVRNDIDDRMKHVLAGERDASIDYSCSTVLFPTGDGFLILVFTEHDEFVDMFSDDLKVADYSYWTTSDRPDNVDEEEWQRRCMQWELVFRSSQIPAHVGYTRDLVRTQDFNPMLTAGDIENAMPPFIERVKRIALDMYIDEADIKDIRTLNRLLSDSRNDRKVNEYEAKVADLIPENVDPNIYFTEHSR